MPWTKGQSGNPRGRLPQLTIGDSLAATIRRVFTREYREQAIAQLVEIARSASTTDQRTRITAFECVARYGWPDEKHGGIGVKISGKDAQVVVQHLHLPIGVAGQDPLLPPGVDRPAYTGVKLGTARHIINSTLVESPVETPAGSEPPDPLPPVPTGRVRSRARTRSPSGA
jgi:hypothetical protein